LFKLYIDSKSIHMYRSSLLCCTVYACRAEDRNETSYCTLKTESQQLRRCLPHISLTSGTHTHITARK